MEDTRSVGWWVKIHISGIYLNGRLSEYSCVSVNFDATIAFEQCSRTLGIRTENDIITTLHRRKLLT
ncbi:MAG: hypothetical protein ACR2QW_07435, partial [bacterium]